MEDNKQAREHEHELTPQTEAQSQNNIFQSNDADKLNMARMGKTQEMRRVFSSVSLVSFTAIIMGTWQWIILANSQGLTNGGRAGLFWSYIWTFAGYSVLAVSLADMAAMAPTAGGQYRRCYFRTTAKCSYS